MWPPALKKLGSASIILVFALQAWYFGATPCAFARKSMIFAWVVEKTPSGQSQIRDQQNTG